MQSYMAMDRARRSQTSVPKFGIDPDEPRLVEALSSFTRGKCAFCEASGPLTAHRFRPSGNAQPAADRKDAHLFYVWLTDAWQNLLPICHGCRPAEPTFPVDGARCRLPSPQQIASYIQKGAGLWPSYPPNEKNLLIDPSRETAFDGHFKPKLDGTIVPISPRAALTVETFDLNREERLLQRGSRYRDQLDRLRILLRTHKKASSVAQRAWADLFEFRTMEFGGTCLLLMKRVAARIDLPNGSGLSSSSKDLKHAFQRLASASDALERFDKALMEISREDPSLLPANPGRPRVHRVRAQLRSVEVTNFKAVERMHLELPPPRSETPDAKPLAPALAILGENATGKSSILEAVALALMTEDARRSLELDWQTIPLDPSQMGVEGSPKVHATEVRLTFDSGQTATLSIVEGLATVRSEFGSEKVSVFAYGAFRRFSGDLPASMSSRHVRNLFDASPLANPEAWLRSLQPQTFDLVVRTLRDLLSIEGDFDVVQRAGRSRRLRMVTAVADPDGTVRYSRTPLQAVSSGYRSMLGMLCDILRGLLEAAPEEEFTSFERIPGVVLIDEIEAHLHPRWKVQVMTSLRRTLPGVTFIVTTHDPLCLRGMGTGEVVVLQRVASSDSGVESNLPIIVERMKDLPAAADLRIEQLLTSDFFQLFSTTDAAADRRMARIGDLVRWRAEGQMLTAEDARVLAEFERDIASALPVGSSEVHRMIQEAVAEFLVKRRAASSATLARLSQKAKDEILAALETL